MVRVQSASGVSPSISVHSGKPVLRRDLRQQASRFALMSAIGLAAAAGGSLMTPGEALADCTLNVATVVCNTTTTTNTSHPVGQPNDRAYQVLEGSPLNASVTPGSSVTGQGLAFSNLGDGGVSVVNNGTITVDAGNAPTAGGTAALTINANGGVLSYVGGAIINNGTGNGLDAIQNGGNDTIDINVTGGVRGATGINARNNGGGAAGISIAAAGPVTGTAGEGIAALTLGGGGIAIAAGDVTAQNGIGVEAQLAAAPGSTNDITISADNVVGADGVFAFNGGVGDVSVTTTGNVTATVGIGVGAFGGGNIDVTIGGVVTAGTSGVVAIGAGDISVHTTAVTALSGHGVSVDNQGAGEVNVAATGPIIATDGHGVVVGDTAVGGDISVTTGAVSAMSATYNGIDILSNSATADISVVANGDIEAGNHGIIASTAAGSTGNIDVTANGSVTGAAGVNAFAAGTGSVNVATVGPVTATNGSGIVAAAVAGGNVTVSAGEVTSANSTGVQVAAAGSGAIDVTTGRVSGVVGIDVVNTGDGATVVRANGTVTGTTGEGIFIEVDNGVELEVAATVTGATDGAFIRGGNAGSGDISVTGAGGFVGLNGDGLDVRNEGAGRVDIDISGPSSATNGNGVIVRDTAIGGDISVTTGAVSANSPGNDGINVNSNSTTANISVVANGDIEAGDFGIEATLDAGSSGDIDVTANGSVTGAGGVFAVTDGTGSVDVITVGPVSATTDRGIVAWAFGGGDVTVDAGDVSSVDDHGVNVYATNGGAIDVTTGAASGTVGLLVQNDGDGVTVVRTEGAVVGTVGEGIYIDVENSVELEVAGTVTGATDGAFIRAGVTGDGDISVTGAGGFVGQNGDGLDVRNLGAGEVDIDISGPTSATNGHGVVVTDTAVGGDISVTTGAVTATSLGWDGISVGSESDTANISVAVNGDVQAGDFGVDARLAVGSSGDIDIEANGSISAAGGVRARTAGTGSVNVTTVGPITATSEYGIMAEALFGGDVTVNAGDVSSVEANGIDLYAQDGGEIDVTTGNVSGEIGISANNNGDGATVIRTNGTVTGREYEGIYVEAESSVSLEVADTVTGAASGAVIRNEGADGDISVTGAGGFVGLEGNGLFVLNEGAGDVDIDISGAVVGTDAVGLLVRSEDNSGDTNVSTGDVTSTGDYAGVLVTSDSLDGNVSITTNGDVVADGGGISTRIIGPGSGDIDVTTNGSVVSGDAGIVAFTQGSGAVTVDASGPITADQSGIVAASQGGDITVTAGDVSSTNADGIQASQLNAAGAGDIDITTTGAISGLAGIRAVNAGSGAVTVNAGGPITADTDGIRAESRGGDITVTAGDLASDGYGVTAWQATAAGTGDIDITTTGSVSSDTGILAENSGSGSITVNASGPIAASDSGVRAIASGGDITISAGEVLSTGRAGIYARQQSAAGTGDISIESTGAVSGETGIDARNDGSGSIAIDASGPITATELGILARTFGGGITIAADAVAAAGDTGIFVEQASAAGTGAIDITATGAVSSVRDGITALNAGSGAIRIAAAGAVTGAGGNGITAQGDAIDVTVGGMVTGGDYGLRVNGGSGGTGDISVTGAGGFAAGENDAVFIFNAGTGTVTYDVSGPVSSTIGSGVVVADTGVGGDISVTTGSVTAMTAGRNAIRVDSASTTADVTIVANGALSAGGDAVRAVLRDGATGNVAVTTRAAVTGENGIVAVNLGTGSTSVTSDGPVTATGTGVFATAVNGDVTVVAGDVTADGPVGIEARIEDGGTGDVSVTAGDVSGGVGIRARNDGAGAVTVVANGAITGTDTDGIVASGESAVTVTVADMVSGERIGLNLAGGIEGDGDILVTGAGGFTGQTGAAAYIQNFGTGTVTFNVAGPMSSADSSGLVIEDTALGGDISVDTGDVTALATGAAAIQVMSASTTADIGLTVNGDLQAGSTGLIAQLGTGATGDINVLTNGAVTALQGIFARNRGTGTVTVTSTGPITAADVGINAASQGGDVTVAAGDVSGDFAIVAWQQNAAGAGNVAVAATGEISGGIGVLAQNDGSGSVSVNASGPITAGDLGITARSQGGDISIAAGSVSGDATYGIHAFQRNAAGAGDIDITAAGTVTGGIHGILASNAGSGDIRITSTGSVASAADGFYGIQAFATDASGDVVIDVNNVSGADAGIRVDNNGVGVTDLTVRGLVQGGRVGVSVFSDDDQDVRIANQGVIRNASGLSSDRAIEASGGFIDFTNTGTLTGDINFQGDNSLFDNRGVWNATGGQSAFGGVDDELLNAATGSILAGTAAGTAELTVFSGLETFYNAGRLTMGDSGTGDQLVTAADTVFAAGSLLQVDIAGLNLADLFATTGTLTLEAGARLDVSFNQPLTLGGRYVVARADGGLTGTFDFQDRLVTAFVGLRDGYTATTAYVEIAQLRTLIEAGETPNQRETARGADSLPGANPLKSALLLLPDDAVAQDAFDQLSGEIHPAVRRAMADDSRLFRDAVLDRLSDERAVGTVWGRALVNERNTDGDGNAAKVEHDGRGLIFGVDRAVSDSLTVGVAGGWFKTDLDLLRRNSAGSTESREVHAYLGGRRDHWRFRAGAGYAMTSTDTRRQIAFAGFSASPRAAYDGSVLQVFVETGYRVPLEGGYVEPFANLTAITAHTHAFHEVEGPAALAVLGMSESLTATTLGFRFQTEGTGDLSLRGSAGWRNLSGDLEPTGRHAFDGGPAFTVLGAVQSDIAAVGALEAQWRLSPNVTLGAAWDGIFGNEGQDHTLTGRLRIAF